MLGVAKVLPVKFDVCHVVFPGPVFLFHGNAGGFWIFRIWNGGERQLGCCIMLFLSAASQRAGETAFVCGFEYLNCFFSSGYGHVLGLRICASGEICIASCFSEAAAMIGEFNLKIAEAVTLVIAAAAFSASLGFLTLGFVFLGIFALVREFSGSVWFKGPSYAAAAAATPRVDVEKGPQAAAAHEYVVASSQVTSRCLVQKHPDFLFVKRKEEREEGKMREDGGDTVLLVRGLQENTMVVRCGAGSTARDLSDSLRVRTSVPVHLFFLVVEGRVIDGDELVRSLGRDCVVSMRGRVLGGSRNVSRMDLSWLFAVRVLADQEHVLSLWYGTSQFPSAPLDRF